MGEKRDMAYPQWLLLPPDDNDAWRDCGRLAPADDLGLRHRYPLPASSTGAYRPH